tara:strand:- start:16944 stop:17441 length:498 start_codon:yes stop_codon:yes gene_type:complete
MSVDKVINILKDCNIKIPKNGGLKMKTVYGYKLDGEYVGVWDSAKECAEYLNLKSSCSISHIASRRHVSYRGYWFSYNFLKKEEMLIALNSRILEGKKKMSSPESKMLRNIHQYTLDGKVLVKVWENSKILKEYYNLKSLNPISRVLNGKSKSYKGYLWKRGSIN